MDNSGKRPASRGSGGIITDELGNNKRGHGEWSPLVCLYLIRAIMADPGLSNSAQRIGVVLATRINSRTGRCIASYRDLAKRHRVSTRAIRAALSGSMDDDGNHQDPELDSYFELAGRGKHGGAIYRAVWSGDESGVNDDGSAANVEALTGGSAANVEALTGDSASPDARQRCHPGDPALPPGTLSAATSDAERAGTRGKRGNACGRGSAPALPHALPQRDEAEAYRSRQRASDREDEEQRAAMRARVRAAFQKLPPAEQEEVIRAVKSELFGAALSNFEHNTFSDTGLTKIGRHLQARGCDLDAVGKGVEAATDVTTGGAPVGPPPENITEGDNDAEACRLREVYRGARAVAGG